MSTVIAVFVGGGLGSVCRYAIGKWVMVAVATRFPLGTLMSNVLACAILGLLWMQFGKGDVKQSGWLAFGIVGFCGGFSTFSTFSFETMRLLRDGFYWWAGANVLLSVLACLAVLYIIVKHP